MSRESKWLTNAQALRLSEDELLGELRSCFGERTGRQDLSSEEDRCLWRLAGDIRSGVYTWSQVESAMMVPGWRPGDDVLSQGN